MFEALSAPFPAEAIHWRAQTVTADGTKALALAYIDARDAMGRFDDVCGPAAWSDSYTETAKGRVLCTISVKADGEWVAKSDGAGSTDVEGDKGAISDAFKRCAVKWGVGRYLYDIGNVWAPCETYERSGKKVWKAWKPEAQAIFAQALAKVSRPTGPINDTTRDWLQAQIQAANTTPQDLLRHFTPPSLKALTFEQMPEAKRFLDSLKNKKAA